jgi:phenylpyruvate tautomerase PptA (4-oxalocrotonate tautomerase family)
LANWRNERKPRQELDMPIGYLDVPTGADLATKRELVKAIYDAMHEVYPFPDDTRIFLREWPLDAVSQNGELGSEPARPVFTIEVPRDGQSDTMRIMIRQIHEAVSHAYGLPDFMTFLHEHTLTTVANNGVLLADDQQRVEEQQHAYPTSSSS